MKHFALNMLGLVASIMTIVGSYFWLVNAHTLVSMIVGSIIAVIGIFLVTMNLLGAYLEFQDKYRNLQNGCG